MSKNQFTLSVATLIQTIQILVLTSDLHTTLILFWEALQMNFYKTGLQLVTTTSYLRYHEVYPNSGYICITIYILQLATVSNIGGVHNKYLNFEHQKMGQMCPFTVAMLFYFISRVKIF